MIWNYFTQSFETVANLVLWLAGAVQEPYVPGLVVSVLIVALVLCIFLFWKWSRELLKSVAVVKKIIVGGTDTSDISELREIFYQRQPEVSTRLKKLGQSKSTANQRIAFAWSEYRETLKVDSDSRLMLNGIRPSVFFNTDDLDAEARGWRAVPGLFVSIGLAATFLGLIAALQQTGETLASPVMFGADVASTDTAGALQQLLLIASAKFIMSVTGLACSIVFTIVLRRRLGKLEHAIDLLCIDIERRVGFIALESLAFDQKKLIEEQKEHTQKMNTELIAAIGRSLNEELPRAISDSISRAIEPMMSQVGQAGTEGVREMVGNLADQFSGDVASAMSEAAERFEVAAKKIDELAEALRESAGDVSGSMQKSIDDLSVAITTMKEGLATGARDTTKAFETGSADVLERMNASLSDIKEAMSAANEEQKAAASSISDAANSFSQRVDQAGQSAGEQAGKQMGLMTADVATKMSEALKPMLLQAQALTTETSDSVIKPVRQLTSVLEGFVSRLEQGTNQMDGLSSALSKTTDAASRSAEVLGEASGSLKLAADPVATLARNLSVSASASAEAAVGIANSLEGQREIVKMSMDSLTESLVQFQSVIERYDDLDEKLGDAFIAFREEVDASIERIGEHADGVHETYADALSMLQSVVDQAAEFKPGKS